MELTPVCVSRVYRDPLFCDIPSVDEISQGNKLLVIIGPGTKGLFGNAVTADIQYPSGTVCKTEFYKALNACRDRRIRNSRELPQTLPGIIGIEADKESIRPSVKEESGISKWRWDSDPQTVIRVCPSVSIKLFSPLREMPSIAIIP